MEQVIQQAGAFILIIFLAYFLKRKGYIKESDGNIISFIIANITLPCALLAGTVGIELSGDTTILILLGLLTNIIMAFVGYGAKAGDSKLLQGVFMLNVSGYNIGNFVLPFVQAVMPLLATTYLSAFNIGATFMGVGGIYALSDHIIHKTEHFEIRNFLKILFSSISLDIYIIVFILMLFDISMPRVIINTAAILGSANTFLAMFLVGMLLDFQIKKAEFVDLLKILVLRYAGAAIFTIITYLFLPLPALAKEVLMIIYFSPILNIATIFSKKIGYDGNLSANAGTLTIILSIIFYLGIFCFL